MRKLTLLSLLGILALSAAACEDDTKTPPRDGGAERLDMITGDTRDGVSSDTPPTDTTVDLRDAPPAVDQTVDLRDAPLPVDISPGDSPEAGVDAIDAADTATDATDAGTDLGTDAGSDAGTDAGGDSGTDGGTDLGTDLGTDVIPVAQLINGCTTFEDRTADTASRLLAWEPAIATNPARCMKVKVGQMVSWNGNFSVYPLAPFPADPSTPIAGKTSGTDLIAQPTTLGTFGYHCTANQPTMRGALYVVP